jgi:hypothetical protein
MRMRALAIACVAATPFALAVGSQSAGPRSNYTGAPPRTPARSLAGTPAPRSALSSLDVARDDAEPVEGSQARRARPGASRR